MITTHCRAPLPVMVAAVGTMLWCLGCTTAGPGRASAAESPLVTISESALPRPLTIVAYGDMRFTAPTETRATWPTVRRALIARIAAEKPAALFLNGDVPMQGGNTADYAVYRDETRAWGSLRVYPALGNHELYGCEEAQCLENWWTTFPYLRGHRWYSVALGSRIRSYVLDSDISLLPGSPQRQWLESQIGALPHSVRFVLLTLHHPPIADLATGPLSDHNPRPNEIALADYLRGVAATTRARLVVIAGHIHNYEHFEQDGVTYLVSGDGGAMPYPVERTAADLYAGKNEPNFHYLRFTLKGRQLVSEMIRLADPTAASPHEFEVRDRFGIRGR